MFRLGARLRTLVATGATCCHGARACGCCLTSSRFRFVAVQLLQCDLIAAANFRISGKGVRGPFEGPKLPAASGRFVATAYSGYPLPSLFLSQFVRIRKGRG